MAWTIASYGSFIEDIAESVIEDGLQFAAIIRTTFPGIAPCLGIYDVGWGNSMRLREAAWSANEWTLPN